MKPIVAPPPAALWTLRASGAFMLLIAAAGVALYVTGHTLRGHPYAETTLGILGLTTLLGTLPAAGGGRATVIFRVCAAVLGGVSAILWVVSAVRGFSG